MSCFSSSLKHRHTLLRHMPEKRVCLRSHVCLILFCFLTAFTVATFVPFLPVEGLAMLYSSFHLVSLQPHLWWSQEEWYSQKNSTSIFFFFMTLTFWRVGANYLTECLPFGVLVILYIHLYLARVFVFFGLEFVKLFVQVPCFLRCPLPCT